MTRMAVFFLFILFTTNLHAQERTAEQLVESKKKANITYRQLMEIMGSASALINEGIVRENPQMVRDGSELIADHPAPNHKPWTIVEKSDQGAFKQSLLTFDKIMHNQADNIAMLAEGGDWFGASKSAHNLMNTCISCHANWTSKVVDGQ